MQRLYLAITFLGITGLVFGSLRETGFNSGALALDIAGPHGTVSRPTNSTNPCNMQLAETPAIFCETFDTKNPGIASRTGDLDPNVWGVSRVTGFNNFGGMYNEWASTIINKCDGTTPTVTPPNDVIICNGQLREASSDNPKRQFDAGGVNTLAMYPKQPFDFAGRTGTVSFDISNDSHGNHAAWPEFWMSDLPVPAPFNHFDSWIALPANGFGIRFAAAAPAKNPGSCPNLKNFSSPRWTVDSAVVVRNHVYEDTNGLGGVQTGLTVTRLDCVIAPPDNSGIMNHVELRISQNRIDVYATDAGVAPSPTTLRKIAVISNASLTLTRGLIWLEDVHYNADKGERPSQREHTFSWDNVAFDGPFTYRDFSYDAPDNTLPGPDGNGSVNLGKLALAGQSTSWNVPNVPANPNSAAVRVLFNFYHYDRPTAINVSVNGHDYTQAWPYPDTRGFTPRTDAIIINKSDLVAGTNTVTIGGTDQAIIVSNVNIVLVDVPGGVPVLPGSVNTYPGSTTAAMDGACGSANGTTVASTPTVNLCNAGKASSVSGTAPLTWTCTGLNGGTTATCSVQTTTATVVNGACGSANGTTVSRKPTANLCSTGTATAVSGSRSWTWSCNGSNDGTNASCSANIATATMPPSPGTFTATANCNLGPAAAFCDTFDEGPASTRGRAGDLDSSKWGVGRISGEIQNSASSANPQFAAPIPSCRATFTQTFVYAPNDTLICDPSGTKTAQLMTATAIQQYGSNSYMIRQPFDFAGRTGKIDFDVDVLGNMVINQLGNTLGGFIEIMISDEPVPGPTFREFNNFEVGAVPKNGLSVKFGTLSGCNDGVSPFNTMVYNNYSGTIITPTFDHVNGCAAATPRALNHFELQVSQNRIDVYGSDASTDNGKTFPNYKLLYSADISLPFTRGYVHVNARNHASTKYGFGPVAIFHWDNIGFDGPVLAAPRAYEIPNNTTALTYQGFPAINLGYQLHDVTSPTGVGIFDPTNKIGSLSFKNVNISGITSATLTLNAYFAANIHTPDTTWGISYRFNGGTWRAFNLTPAQIAGMSNNTGGLVQGIVSFVVSVPTTDLIQGTNEIEFLPVNSPMDYPPVIANIDLLLH